MLQKDQVPSTTVRCERDARREHDCACVRAEIELLITAKGLRRTSASRDFDTSTGVAARPSLCRRATNRCERVPLLQVSQCARRAACTPGRRSPPAATRATARARRCEPFLGAFEIPALRQDLHRNGEGIARRGDLEGRDVERIIRHLQRIATIERQAPHLRRA